MCVKKKCHFTDFSRKSGNISNERIIAFMTPLKKKYFHFNEKMFDEKKSCHFDESSQEIMDIIFLSTKADI